MAEVKSVETDQETGKTTIVLEVEAKELTDRVIERTVQVLATGLGNNLIVNHMKTLTELFTDRFRTVIAKIMEKSAGELVKDLEMYEHGGEVPTPPENPSAN